MLIIRIYIYLMEYDFKNTEDMWCYIEKKSCRAQTTELRKELRNCA